MKLLFDQNISFRVIRGIIDIYPDAKQVNIISTFRENIDLIQEFVTGPEYQNIGCQEISK